MDIEACIQLIFQHLEDGDIEEASASLQDARNWVRNGGSVTPDQYDRMRKANSMLMSSKVESTPELQPEPNI